MCVCVGVQRSCRRLTVAHQVMQPSIMQLNSYPLLLMGDAVNLCNPEEGWVLLPAGAQVREQMSRGADGGAAE